MEAVKVITDSSVQLTEKEMEDYDITVVPLSIHLDGKLYGDTNSVSNADYIRLMEDSKDLPKTSQPSVGLFQETFAALSSDDTELLFIGMTEKLSGTINSARMAAENIEGPITIVDSGFTDRGLGFQVLEAAKLAKAGKSVDEILPILEKVKQKTTLYVFIDKLDNLVKGGRVGHISGLVSSLLKIKVILELKNGELEVIEKGRGTKTIDHFVSNIIKELKDKAIAAVGLSHADAEDKVAAVEEQFLQIDPSLDILTALTGPVVATHTGTGAFAIIYREV